MTRLRSLLFLIAYAASVSGCATFQQKQPIYMIKEKDIQPMQAGESFTAKENGWFISEYYLSEVMNASAEDAKRMA